MKPHPVPVVPTLFTDATRPGGGFYGVPLAASGLLLGVLLFRPSTLAFLPWMDRIEGVRWLAFGVLLFALIMAVGWASVQMGTVGASYPKGLTTWLDVYASSDLVPSGPTVIVGPGRYEKAQVRYEEAQVLNLRSWLLDHTTYWDNDDQVWPLIIARFLAYGGAPYRLQLGSRVGTATRRARVRALVRGRWLALGATALVLLFSPVGWWPWAWSAIPISWAGYSLFAYRWCKHNGSGRPAHAAHALVEAIQPGTFADLHRNDLVYDREEAFTLEQAERIYARWQRDEDDRYRLPRVECPTCWGADAFSHITFTKPRPRPDLGLLEQLKKQMFPPGVQIECRCRLPHPEAKDEGCGRGVQLPPPGSSFSTGILGSKQDPPH